MDTYAIKVATIKDKTILNKMSIGFRSIIYG